MKIKKLPIIYNDNNRGRYSISPNIANKNALISWIRNKEYVNFVNDKYKLKRHTRKRNSLYSFNHSILQKKTILKVSRIDKQYKLLRRINLIFSTLINDYNFRAFTGACLLQQSNIMCPTPIAYWNEKKYFWATKSFYLYEKIEANESVYSFVEKITTKDKSFFDKVLNLLAHKITEVVKNIHDKGFRQGDPHPGNFLITNLNKDIDKLTLDDINQTNIAIIDLDKFSTAHIRVSPFKEFLDVRCFRRCTLGHFNQYDMLNTYLGNKSNKLWNSILSFWMLGGFNFAKWFKKEDKVK